MRLFLILSSILFLESCCCQEQGAPKLHPMPKYVNQSQPILEIPVENSFK